MRLPSVKTLSAVFSDPKRARAVFEMSRAQLLALPAGATRFAECYHPPKTYDLRLHCLSAIESSLHGPEAMKSTAGEYADYLNVGDSYDPTVIYWRGAYRVQSVGDFVETMGRRGVHFA